MSLKPDFVVPVYPVVTLSDSRYVHRRSRLGLLGEWTVLRESMRDSLSLERHVRPDGPPVFLLNCIDDPIVDYHNSVLLDSALTASGVAHRYVQMQTGGTDSGRTPPGRMKRHRPGRDCSCNGWMRIYYKRTVK